MKDEHKTCKIPLYNFIKNMKITVIGGGLSGLTTSAYLAQQGHEVTLLEKNKTLGGRARVLKTKEGFTFDMGPSWYMMPEVIEQIFNELGYSTKDFFTLKELKTKYRVFKDNEKPIDIVSDIQTNLKTFAQINKKDIPGIKSLFTKTLFSYNLATKQFLQRPYHSFIDFLSLTDIINGIRLLVNFNPLQNYHHFIQKHISNKTLQQIFEFHTVFLGGSPYTTPALYSILIAADFYKKIWYPQGGMGELVTALQTICHKHNVTIITGKSVEKLIIKRYKQT
jgi:phytoene desaturase